MKALSFSFPKVDFIPKQFLRSWYDPSLAGIDKEAALTWVAESIENTSPSMTKLKVIN